MSEASLAAQRIIVTTLRAAPAVTGLVPALSIFDRSSRPEAFPCIIVGEAYATGSDTDCGEASEVYCEVHVWTAENGMVACKTIAGAVRRAMKNIDRVHDGFRTSFNFESVRFLRDPDGEHIHGVVEFMALSDEESS